MTSVTSNVEDRLAHRTVLVADDSEAVRTAFQVLLSLHGARVLGASSPAEALATVRSQEVDLVIQDMNFRREATSGEEGVALFQRIARAASRRAGDPADRVDAPGNRRGPGEGRRRRLHRQALGRRAAADDGAQPARAARRGRRERRHARTARRGARPARRALRPARPRLRKRRAAHGGVDGGAGGACRRAGAHHRPQRRRQGSAGRHRARQLRAQGRSPT